MNCERHSSNEIHEADALASCEGHFRSDTHSSVAFALCPATHDTHPIAVPPGHLPADQPFNETQMPDVGGFFNKGETP